jgi:hypothetical protein
MSSTLSSSSYNPKPRRDVRHQGASVATITTSIQDPMAAAVYMSSYETHFALGRKPLWTIKLLYVLFATTALGLFVLAGNDPLAMQLVSCISMLVLVY